MWRNGKVNIITNENGGRKKKKLKMKYFKWKYLNKRTYYNPEDYEKVL